MRQSPEKGAKQPRFSFSISLAAAVALCRLADEQGRSVSSLASHMITSQLEAGGHLPKARRRPRAKVQVEATP